MKRLFTFLCAALVVLSASAGHVSKKMLDQKGIKKEGKIDRVRKSQTIKTVKFAKFTSSENAAVRLSRAPQSKLATDVTIVAVDVNNYGTDGEFYFSNADESIQFYMDIYYGDTNTDLEPGKKYTIADMDETYFPEVFYDGQWNGLASAEVTKTIDVEGLVHYVGAATDTLGVEFTFHYDEEPFILTGDTIEIQPALSVTTPTYSASYEDWTIRGEDAAYYFMLDIFSDDSLSCVGVHSNFDLDYTYVHDYANDKRIAAKEAKAEIISRNDTLLIFADIVGEDGNVYEISAFYAAPSALSTETINAENLVITQESYYGLFNYWTFEASDANNAIYFELWEDDYNGSWTSEISGTVSPVSGLEATIYSANVTIATIDDTTLVTGTVLCNNNVEYTLNLKYVKPAPDWIELGMGKLTSTLDAIFSGSETTEDMMVYKSAGIPGLYAVENPFGASYAIDPYLVFHAENPELIYILPTQLINTGDQYGILSVMSYGGYYLNKYPTYDAAGIAAALGDDTEAVWGKQNKNVISFTSDALLAALSNYSSGNPLTGASARLILELPDLEAPVIISADSVFVGADRAIFAITANDDADDVDDLTFSIKNGDDVLAADAKTNNGKLTIEGLEKSTAYNLTLIAVDRAGRSSDPFALSFVTVETSDTEAPTLVSAEIAEVSDKWATIAVVATDNETPAEDIIFVVTFADASSVELAPVAGLIKVEGLTPETAYEISVAAKDNAGNVSVALSVNFTTLELIPIEMNIDWIQARYYANYSEEGRQNFMISFWEGDANSVIFDVYTPKADAISGEYDTSDRILLPDSKINYNGATINLLSGKVSLEFISLNADNTGNYKGSFEAFGADGNKYIGGAELMVYTYSGSGSSSVIVPMTGEVESPVEGIEETLAEGKAVKVVRDNQIIILKGDKAFNAVGNRVK